MKFIQETYYIRGITPTNWVSGTDETPLNLQFQFWYALFLLLSDEASVSLTKLLSKGTK